MPLENMTKDKLIEDYYELARVTLKLDEELKLSQIKVNKLTEELVKVKKLVVKLLTLSQKDESDISGVDKC